SFKASSASALVLAAAVLVMTAFTALSAPAVMTTGPLKISMMILGVAPLLKSLVMVSSAFSMLAKLNAGTLFAGGACGSPREQPVSGNRPTAKQITQRPCGN